MLRVCDLKTHLFLKRGVLKAVDGVSFHLDTGEALGRMPPTAMSLHVA